MATGKIRKLKMDSKADPNWFVGECDICRGEEGEYLIRFTPDGINTENIYICKSCLKKALKLLEGK